MRASQESIMKRKMISSIVLFTITFVAMLVFVGLYIDETRRTQETYYIQYIENLRHVSDDITSYINAEGDTDLRYTRIVSDMSSANSFAFLLKRLSEEEKIAINELNACIIKYPEQMRERLPEMQTAVEDIIAELDRGYDKSRELVASVDKLGH